MQRLKMSVVAVMVALVSMVGLASPAGAVFYGGGGVQVEMPTYLWNYGGVSPVPYGYLFAQGRQRIGYHGTWTRVIAGRTYRCVQYWDAQGPWQDCIPLDRAR